MRSWGFYGSGLVEKVALSRWQGPRAQACGVPVRRVFQTQGMVQARALGGRLPGRLGVVLAKDPGAEGCRQGPGAPSGQDAAPGGSCSKRLLQTQVNWDQEAPALSREGCWQWRWGGCPGMVCLEYGAAGPADRLGLGCEGKRKVSSALAPQSLCSPQQC